MFLWILSLAHVVTSFLHFKVFPPFKLIPRKVTLLIGAMMQVCEILKVRLHLQTAGLSSMCQNCSCDPVPVPLKEPTARTLVEDVSLIA